MTPKRRKFMEKAVQEILDGKAVGDLMRHMEEDLYKEIIKAYIGEDLDPESEFAKAARDKASQRAAVVVAGAVRNQVGVILEHIEIPLMDDGKRLGEIVFDLMEPYGGLDKSQAKKIAELERYYKSKTEGTIGKHREQLLKANEKYRGERIGKILDEEVFHVNKAGAYATAADLGFVAKRSIHANDALVCPICIENAAVGWIPIDSEYPSMELNPPFHPNCRCDEVYADGAALKAEQEAAA